MVDLLSAEPDISLSEEELIKLQSLHVVMGRLCKEIGVAVLNPASFL